MRNNREEGELSTFQPVGDMGFRQAKDDDSFKPSVVMNAQAAAPQSMPHRSIKFYGGDSSQAAGNKIVEINTSNQMMFKQTPLLHDEHYSEPSREERFQQNAAIYNSRKQNLIQVIS